MGQPDFDFLINNGAAVNAHTTRQSLMDDVFANAKTALVSVRSIPRDTFTDEPIIAEEAISVDNAPTGFRFYGRIIQVDDIAVDPSIFYPDECDTSQNIGDGMSPLYVACYTLFESTETVSGIIPPQYSTVEVDLLSARNGKTFSRSYGRFSGIRSQVNAADIVSSNLDSKCTPLSALNFGAGGAGSIGGSGPQTATYHGSSPPISITNGNLEEKGLIKRAEAGCAPRKPKILKDVVGDWNSLVNAFEAASARAASFTAKNGKSYTLKKGLCLGGSGNRTYAVQLDCKRRKPRLAAKPGYSPHGFGVAVDIRVYENGELWDYVPFDSAVYQWLLKNAPTHNWEHPSWAQESGSKPEPWHWESLRRDQLIKDKDWSNYKK
jgi:hypothetical protein